MNEHAVRIGHVLDRDDINGARPDRGDDQSLSQALGLTPLAGNVIALRALLPSPAAYSSPADYYRALDAMATELASLHEPRGAGSFLLAEAPIEERRPPGSADHESVEFWVNDRLVHASNLGPTGGEIMDAGGIRRGVGLIAVLEDGTQVQVGEDEVVDLRSGARFTAAPRFLRG